jgi:surfactin synthase thioesterase subunit
MTNSPSDVVARRSEPLAVERIGCLRRFGERREGAIRLVCFPWSGAGASAYRFLAAALPAPVELYSVQLPGREERFREPPLRRMHEVVAHVLPHVAPLRDRPLHFFGHSLGALMAYETALALRDTTACEPDGLIVSGHVAPHRADRTRFARSTASDAEFAAHIAQLGGTPSAIVQDEETFRMLLASVRVDYEVLETYRPKDAAPLSCRLQPCAGTGDPLVSPEGMAAWQGHGHAAQAPHWFSGGHFYLTALPAELAAHVAEWLRPQGDVESHVPQRPQVEVESHVPQPSVGMSRTQ